MSLHYDLLHDGRFYFSMIIILAGSFLTFLLIFGSYFQSKNDVKNSIYNLKRLLKNLDDISVRLSNYDCFQDSTSKFIDSLRISIYELQRKTPEYVEETGRKCNKYDFSEITRLTTEIENVIKQFTDFVDSESKLENFLRELKKEINETELITKAGKKVNPSILKQLEFLQHFVKEMDSLKLIDIFQAIDLMGLARKEFNTYKDLKKNADAS